MRGFSIYLYIYIYIYIFQAVRRAVNEMFETPDTVFNNLELLVNPSSTAKKCSATEDCCRNPGGDIPSLFNARIFYIFIYICKLILVASSVHFIYFSSPFFKLFLRVLYAWTVHLVVVYTTRLYAWTVHLVVVYTTRL